MVEHATDPTVAQAWLIAIPSILTALSTWYLRRGTKKSHEATDSKTTERLDSYNGAIKDKIEDLEKKIKELDATVTKSRDCQILLAQKYTEETASLQKDLQAARRALERALGGVKTQPPEEVQPGPPVAAGAPASVKVIDVPQTPIGKVKWEKGE